MNRQLINLACVAGALTFVISIFVQFAMTPSHLATGTQRRAVPTGTPIEQATQIILWNHQDRRLDHQVWRQAAEWLLTSGDPVERLADLDQRLGPDPQKSIAATGFTAYYTGYALLLRDDLEAARRCWEFGLESFRMWSEESRPWLRDADTVYHARTLMRLERDSESYEVIRTLAGVESGEPEDDGVLITQCRLLAEIGRSEQAFDALERAFKDRSMHATAGLLERLINEGRLWVQSFEPEAAEMAQRAAASAIQDIFKSERRNPPWVFERAHVNGRTLLRLGLPERAFEIWAAAEEASVHDAIEETQKEEGGLSPSYWRWTAKFRALQDDPAGAAEAIAKIHPGHMSPDDFIFDPDLGPYMHVPAMRAAVRLHGEPEDWGPSGETPEN